jgi:hypothetical protein
MRKVLSSEQDMNLADVARVVLLKELKFHTCVLCGVDIGSSSMMVCSLHAAQVRRGQGCFHLDLNHL